MAPHSARRMSVKPFQIWSPERTRNLLKPTAKASMAGMSPHCGFLTHVHPASALCLRADSLIVEGEFEFVSNGIQIELGFLLRSARRRSERS